MRIAVIGSARVDVSAEHEALSVAIGTYLAERDVTVVTGGSLGIPGIVVKSAFTAGAHTEMYSPDEDHEQHGLRSDNLSPEYFRVCNFVPGLTARSLAMLMSVDAVLVVTGRMGTLCEFAMALEEGIPVGVIRNTGGIADRLEALVAVSGKTVTTPLVFGDEFTSVIDELLSAVPSSVR